MGRRAPNPVRHFSPILGETPSPNELKLLGAQPKESRAVVMSSGVKNAFLAGFALLAFMGAAVIAVAPSNVKIDFTMPTDVARK